MNFLWINRLRKAGLFDRWLLIAIAIGLLLGVQGFGWGRYDCLNLDRMGLKNVVSNARPWLHPGGFLKPPLYTYLCHFAARVPASFVARNMIWLDGETRKQAYLKIRLALARALNLLMFVGCIVLVFGVTRAEFGIGAARLSSLLLASSAGFIPYQVFLTTDLALVFMMLASFGCAARIVRDPSMGISVAGGLLAGLAAATKYNGLLVAAALPVAHLLASRENPIVDCLKRPSAWACGLAVPIGYLIGNPYTILDWPTFWMDFVYNLKVTPIYNGVTEGNSYGRFFLSFGEILGWPGSAFVLLGLLIGAFSLLTASGRAGCKFITLTTVVIAVYAWKIGEFPRIETRFVLPIAPFFILLAGIGFSVMLRLRVLTITAFAAVVVYNITCGWWVGQLFINDPRMQALGIADQQLPSCAKIEASDSVPRLKDLPGRKLEIVKIPTGIERDANFSKIFEGDEQMSHALERWGTREGPEWFRPEARAERNPDWIFWSTIDLEGVAMEQYDALFREGSGYRVVFDGRSPVQPWWTYPQQTEFIRNRMTVWQRIQSL